MGDDLKQTHDVFLSYSSHDKTWAEAACAVLEGHRVRCWIAPRDIVPGDEWGASIIKGLNASKLMVLIFSGHANASGQVRREVERAISRGMTVLPIRVEDIRPDGAMEFALGNTHWLDAFTPPVEQKLELLAKSVMTLLSKEPVPPKPVAVAPPEPTPSALESAEVPAVAASRRHRPLVAVGAGMLLLAVGAVVLVVRGGSGRDVPAGVVDSKPSPATTAMEVAPASLPTAKDSTPIAVPTTPYPRAREVTVESNPIDFLTRINPDRKGRWIMKDGALRSTGADGDNIRLPIRLVPPEYKLELTVTRLSNRPNHTDLFVVLPIGLSGCMIIFDGWEGNTSAVATIYGGNVDLKESAHHGRVLPMQRPIKVVMIVNRGPINRGQIWVSADGKEIINWMGKLNRPLLPTIPGPNTLFVGASGSEFKIDKLTLTPPKRAHRQGEMTRARHRGLRTSLRDLIFLEPSATCSLSRQPPLPTNVRIFKFNFCNTLQKSRTDKSGQGYPLKYGEKQRIGARPVRTLLRLPRSKAATYAKNLQADFLTETNLSAMVDSANRPEIQCVGQRMGVLITLHDSITDEGDEPSSWHLPNPP